MEKNLKQKRPVTRKNAFEDPPKSPQTHPLDGALPSPTQSLLKVLKGTLTQDLEKDDRPKRATKLGGEICSAKSFHFSWFNTESPVDKKLKSLHPLAKCTKGNMDQTRKPFFRSFRVDSLKVGGRSSSRLPGNQGVG